MNVAYILSKGAQLIRYLLIVVHLNVAMRLTPKSIHSVLHSFYAAHK